MAVRFAEELVVKLFDDGILVGLAQLHLLVGVVDGFRAERGDILVVAHERAVDGLTAAVDAAARTGHYLDEVVISLARAHFLHEFARVGESAGDGDFDLCAADVVSGFLDAFRTADFLEIERFRLFAGHYLADRTQRRLHNAARCAEDESGARRYAERSVELLVGKLRKEDAAAFDELGKFARGDRNVDVGNARRALVGSALLKFLRGARHDGNDRDILRRPTHFLGVVGLDDRTEHLLGGFASGEIAEQVREIVLAELDPRRRTAGDHGKSAAVLQPVEELRPLFHYGEIRAEIDVKDVGEAHSAQSRHHLAFDIGTDGIAELLAESHAYGRRDADHNVFGRIGKRGEHVVYLLTLRERADGTHGDALSAAHAGNFGKRLLESAADVCVETSRIRAYDGD